MSGRVLSTDQAKTAITQIQSIINGGLTEQINALDRQGQTLSQPDTWDGQLAVQFRQDVWPKTKKALDSAVTELTTLREQLQKIATNIMQAGGNA
jgi:uncharacterized protein YukE